MKCEIVRILSEKEGFLRENHLLKDLIKEKESLEQENARLRITIKQLMDHSHGSCSQSANTSHESIEFPLHDRSSPDGQEIEAFVQNPSIDVGYKSILAPLDRIEAQDKVRYECTMA